MVAAGVFLARDSSAFIILVLRVSPNPSVHLRLFQAQRQYKTASAPPPSSTNGRSWPPIQIRDHIIGRGNTPKQDFRRTIYNTCVTTHLNATQDLCGSNLSQNNQFCYTIRGLVPPTRPQLNSRIKRMNGSCRVPFVHHFTLSRRQPRLGHEVSPWPEKGGSVKSVNRTDFLLTHCDLVGHRPLPTQYSRLQKG
jgi:hypothetical protein